MQIILERSSSFAARPFYILTKAVFRLSRKRLPPRLRSTGEIEPACKGEESSSFDRPTRRHYSWKSSTPLRLYDLPKGAVVLGARELISFIMSSISNRHRRRKKCICRRVRRDLSAIKRNGYNADRGWLNPKTNTRNYTRIIRKGPSDIEKYQKKSGPKIFRGFFSREGRKVKNGRVKFADTLSNDDDKIWWCLTF